MTKNYNEMSKAQLLKEIKSIDSQRKTAWKKYYESQQVIFDDRNRQRNNYNEMLRDLREIRDSDNVGELVKTYTKTLYDCYRQYCKDRLTCPITQDEILFLNEAVITKCGHAFKKEALTEWLKNNETCPMCRTNIKY